MRHAPMPPWGKILVTPEFYGTKILWYVNSKSLSMSSVVNIERLT